MEAGEVFEILVRDHSDMLWAYLRSTVFDQNAAEDIYQDTLVVAWRRLPDYDRERPFGAWLRGIAGKLVLAHIRKTGRRRMALCDSETLDSLAQKYDEFEAATSGVWDDKLDALRLCMEKLKEQDAVVLNHHYRGGQDCQAIAETTGIALETVKKRLQRSRAALADCIERRVAGERIRHGAEA
jgi:RNA polymerase sigma-70 factor